MAVCHEIMVTKKIFAVFRTALVAALGAAVVVQSGCLLVAAGAVAGAGTVVYAHGELDASLGNGYESVNRAANRAVDRLQFKKISESKDALTAVLKARTADDTKIDIKITKVTNVLTKVEIRVGVFGDRSVSATILKKIKESL